MAWEQFEDYATAFIGAILLFISLIVIPEIRQNRLLLITTVLLMFFFGYLGVDKVKRDIGTSIDAANNDSIQRKKIDSLNEQIKEERSIIASYHRNDLIFQDSNTSFNKFVSSDIKSRQHQMILNYDKRLYLTYSQLEHIFDYFVIGGPASTEEKYVENDKAMILQCLDLLAREYDNPVLQNNDTVNKAWQWFTNYLISFYDIFNPDSQERLTTELIGNYEGPAFIDNFTRPINEFYTVHDSTFIIGLNASSMNTLR